MKKPGTYEVTLRRDVQQVARVRVDAYSRQEAIDTAEAVNAGWDNVEWSVEELIGTHPPKVQLQRNTPIKGRSTGKADRRGVRFLPGFKNADTRSYCQYSVPFGPGTQKCPCHGVATAAPSSGDVP